MTISTSRYRQRFTWIIAGGGSSTRSIAFSVQDGFAQSSLLSAGVVAPAIAQKVKRGFLLPWTGGFSLGSTSVWSQKSGRMAVRRGAIFTGLMLST